jgi:2-polyprenyl-3-methyl-5-hydroxy-6-metoxy-1,4-benzoquinol methylase
LRERFLEEILQYIPRKGNVLDIGCGFGLFSLYFAKMNKHAQFYGVDLSQKRISLAKDAAKKLKIHNAHYSVGSATELVLNQTFDAIYAIDIIHHIPKNSAKELISALYHNLSAKGVLIIKDIEEKPVYKLWFTFILDKVMDYNTPVNYWKKADLKNFLMNTEFEVFHHSMLDYLPYPHIIYVCRKI